MTTVQITLPDQLAQDAQHAGLLAPARLAQLLRDQLESLRVDELFTNVVVSALHSSPSNNL